MAHYVSNFEEKFSFGMMKQMPALDQVLREHKFRANQCLHGDIGGPLSSSCPAPTLRRSTADLHFHRLLAGQGGGSKNAAGVVQEVVPGEPKPSASCVSLGPLHYLQRRPSERSM